MAQSSPGLIAATKLLRPEARPESITRARLSDALDHAARRPLVVVCAPAGYGKTTALVHWLESFGIAHAWISLDAHDSDPGRLAAHLLAALEPLLPGSLDGARRALVAGSDLGATVVPLIANSLAERSGDRLAIVLDDYHLVTDARCHALVDALIAAAPLGVSVVVSTRAMPPLRLGRRRVTGAVAELGPDDLRFGRSETERLLNGPLQLALEPAQLDAIDDRLDGWPAGLALIAQALAGRDDGGSRDSLPDALASSRAGLEAFVVEEVLDAGDPELRDFLLRTSILNRLNTSLCEAVLDDPRARDQLDAVRRMSLFVTALDPEGAWLRYHPIFAEVLRGELERRAPELAGELHGRASVWFERAGLLDEAIEHALGAGDGARAAALLSRAWAGLIAERRQVTVRRVLDRLPEERGDLGPFCEALDLLCMIYEGVDQRITHERAERLAAEHHHAPGVSLLVDMIRISPFYGDVARAAEVGREAWERYADSPKAREHLVGQLATVLWFAGDYGEVRRLLEPRLGLEQPPFARIWMLSALALTAADEGDPERAERYAREAMTLLEEAGGQTATVFVGVNWVLAEALRLRGRLAEARERLSHALEVEAQRPASVGHAVALAFDAHLALAEGNRRRARASARRAREIVERYPDVGTLGERIARVEVALEGRAGEGLAGSDPTAAERRVLELLPTEMTLAEIAEQLFLSRNTVKSHVRRLYARLGRRSRTEAVAAARERGLL